MKTIKLVIYGEPEAKQRPRVSMANGIVRTYTPSKTTNYESLIRHEYTEKYGGITFDRDTPIIVSITAYFGLSKCDYGKKGLSKSGREKIAMDYCMTHKDLDNIAKIVLDSLNNVCFVDDKQVVVLNCYKRWTQESPRVEIVIGEIEYETSLS